MVLYANPAACTILKKNIGRLAGEILGVPLVLDVNHELNLVTGDAQAVTLSVNLAQVIWYEEKAYLATIHNISKEKQKEASLIRQ